MKQKDKKIWAEYAPRDYIADHDINSLLFFEEKGFGNKTISEMIDDYLEYVQSNRHKNPS